MKIQQFNGGIRNLPQPQFLGVNEAVYSNNIDSDKQILRGKKSALKTAIGESDPVNKDAFYWLSKDTVLSQPNKADTVEYGDILYRTYRNDTLLPQTNKNGASTGWRNFYPGKPVIDTVSIVDGGVILTSFNNTAGGTSGLAKTVLVDPDMILIPTNDSASLMLHVASIGSVNSPPNSSVILNELDFVPNQNSFPSGSTTVSTTQNLDYNAIFTVYGPVGYTKDVTYDAYVRVPSGRWGLVAHYTLSFLVSPGFLGNSVSQTATSYGSGLNDDVYLRSTSNPNTFSSEELQALFDANVNKPRAAYKFSNKQIYGPASTQAIKSDATYDFIASSVTADEEYATKESAVTDSITINPKQIISAYGVEFSGEYLYEGGFVLQFNLQEPTDTDYSKLFTIDEDTAEYVRITAEQTGSNYIDKGEFSSPREEASTLDTTLSVEAKYLTEYKGTFFAAIDDSIIFSSPARPFEWPTAHKLDFGFAITAIIITPIGIIVAGLSRCELIRGTTADTISKVQLSGTAGCIGQNTVAYRGSYAVWLGPDGVYISAGNEPQNLTKHKLGVNYLDMLDPESFTGAAIADEDTYIVTSVDIVTGELDGLSTYIDFVQNAAVHLLSIPPNTTDVIRYKGQLATWSADSDTRTIHKLFQGGTTLAWAYESPRFIEGRATENKTYKDVLVLSRGAVKLCIFINDKLVQEKELRGFDAHTVQVPQKLQRGFYISFKLEGEVDSEVLELEYVVGKT